VIGSGSAKKYVFYAIGEIALVVIGILIALQINNWNEARKAQIREQHALEELLSDLDVSIASLNYILYEDENNIEDAIYSLNRVILFLEKDLPYVDSLGDDLRNIHQYPDFDFKSSGYESLLSMGMDIVSNNKLRSDIGRFYSFIVPKLDKAYTEIRDDFYNYILYFLREKFDVDLDGNRMGRVRPVDFETLKEDHNFLISLKVYLSVFDYYQGKVLETLEEAKALKKQIGTYIQNGKDL
jgi:hypothetical protein